MTSDGKSLEALVAFVEQTLLPSGFDIKTNKLVRDGDGNLIAEFDVQIRGKVGSTEIAWLIECRDRPSDGPQPGAWIEQLVGRRDRFLFNKVTAVSTTGFAVGARNYAKEAGIELREVKSLSPEEFSSWMQLGALNYVHRRTTLDGVHFGLSPDESEERQGAFAQAIAGDAKELRLVKSATGERVELRHAFLGLVEQNPQLFDGLMPNGEPRRVTLAAEYTNDEDHFVLDTAQVAVRLQRIIFEGSLSITEKAIPLSVTAEYSGVDGGQRISQYAAFEPFDSDGASVVIEMHRIDETGETIVVARSERKE